MTRFLDDMEPLYSSFCTGMIWLYITLAAIIIFIAMTVRQIKRNEEPWAIALLIAAVLFSLFPWLVGFSTLCEKVEFSVGSAAETELTHCQVSVLSEYSNSNYTDYALRCGRFNSIYVRIQKFPEVYDNLYAVTLGGENKCWISDSAAISVINEAINRYELYGK